ncbi:ABC transporter ATP-binding protein [Mesoplasma coleopterae]|uniref:ABC transporter ATP-binding protein n=1 Tax=Mesoplasma coleopterae TaxID=324078 RepID=UPI000D02587A|nr:ATP-binding cassette domain-containing protein [Mesoplasma coleopterae]AVN62998.1 multidrug ABC transporter ATP-binding protein [Mesoplasma coleopterae]
MIKIQNITKKYSDNSGNFNINIEIAEGKVYGIVGPNGAGKTTLIRQILGFIKSDTGEILINQLNPIKEREKIMEFTGYVAGEIKLFDQLTGEQYLNLNKDFHKNVDEQFLNNLILHFDIDTKRKIKKMSKGMKQKIALIAATMHKPKFLVLDEPTSGLDPIMQKQFNELILTMKKKYNTTIIICSHIFEEISKLSDKVGFIKDGELVKEYIIKERDIKELEKEFENFYKKESIL